MRSPWGNPDAVAREIQGRFRQGTDKIVAPQKISGVCRHLWPLKTAAHIAAIAGTNERTAHRWLSGEFPFPFEVWLAVLHEMNKREGD